SEFSMCCAKGTIELLPLPRPPEPLYSYYHGRSPGTYVLPCLLPVHRRANISFHVGDRKFRENLRNYNNAFAFTSLGVSVDLISLSMVLREFTRSASKGN